MSEKFRTSQEELWAGPFGDEYNRRNASAISLASDVAFFAAVLKKTFGIRSVIEFGANNGLNLQALSFLKPGIELSGLEINPAAAAEMNKIPGVKGYTGSLLDFNCDYPRDLVLLKAVLIHLNPDSLERAYQIIFDSSSRYICLAEFYNPTPVAIEYRTEQSALFKRDFAGEMLDRFRELQLVDYGFVYHRDNNFSQGDLNWFLLEKR